MIGKKRVIRRSILCLVAAMVILTAAVPALRGESSIAWAAKKTSKKSKASEKKKNGFVKKYGNWYYYIDGKKQTGWFTVGKREFYAYRKGNKYRKGKLLTGWHNLKGVDYYFRVEGKKGVICSLAADGVAKVNGIKCIFDSNCQIVGCKYAGSTKGFVNKVGEMARMNQAKNNILASLVVAQACLETGFGANIYGNNLFGIREGSGYRTYDSWEESIEDYVEFMRTYIPGIFGVRDSDTACYIIGRSGYAEAGGYGDLLMSIINENNLYRFNR